MLAFQTLKDNNPCPTLRSPILLRPLQGARKGLVSTTESSQCPKDRHQFCHKSSPQLIGKEVVSLNMAPVSPHFLERQEAYLSTFQGNAEASSCALEASNFLATQTSIHPLGWKGREGSPQGCCPWHQYNPSWHPRGWSPWGH